MTDFTSSCAHVRSEYEKKSVGPTRSVQRSTSRSRRLANQRYYRNATISVTEVRQPITANVQKLSSLNACHNVVVAGFEGGRRGDRPPAAQSQKFKPMKAEQTGSSAAYSTMQVVSETAPSYRILVTYAVHVIQNPKMCRSLRSSY